MVALNKNVIVVDDNTTVLNVIERVLKRVGCKVFTAKSKEEALRLCSEINLEIHICLIDLFVSTNSGLELAKRLKNSYPKIKILFMTGYSDSFLEQEKISISSENCLYKPFKPSELLDKLNEILVN